MNCFFTRLTSNFNDWRNPSGRNGKCNSSNAQQPLYEQTNSFGWEEWLFEEYHKMGSAPEHICNGFIEAFNQKNRTKGVIDRLYLYTKVCTNKVGIASGYYFVGYIDNVKQIAPIPKNQNEVQADLIAVDITHNGYLPMLRFAKNISFLFKDVHVKFPLVFTQPIQLNPGQFRFSLYDLNEHPNFLSAINNYL